METGAATSQATPEANQQTLWVGKDRLTIFEGFVVIDAANEMLDWQVREFQRTPIFLGDFKFFVRQKIKGERPFALRYLLERWPDDAQFDAAAFSYVYDEQFVAERDAEVARLERNERLGRILICFYPLLGFLWSGVKKKLVPAGFIPRSINGVSIFTCVCLMLLQGTFLRMRLGLFTMIFGKLGILELGLLTADYALLFLMLADTVIRLDQQIKAVVEYPWGFCEWVTKPFRRKSVEGEETQS